MRGGKVTISTTAFLNETSQKYNDQLLVLSKLELSKYDCMHLTLNYIINIELPIPNVKIHSQL
jgi:hypothetical protein